jgi:hypothetical protein
MVVTCVYYDKPGCSRAVKRAELGKSETGKVVRGPVWGHRLQQVYSFSDYQAIHKY